MAIQFTKFITREDFIQSYQNVLNTEDTKNGAIIDQAIIDASNFLIQTDLTDRLEADFLRNIIPVNELNIIERLTASLTRWWLENGFLPNKSSASKTTGQINISEAISDDRQMTEYFYNEFARTKYYQKTFSAGDLTPADNDDPVISSAVFSTGEKVEDTSIDKLVDEGDNVGLITTGRFNEFVDNNSAEQETQNQKIEENRVKNTDQDSGIETNLNKNIQQDTRLANIENILTSTDELIVKTTNNLVGTDATYIKLPLDDEDRDLADAWDTTNYNYEIKESAIGSRYLFVLNFSSQASVINTEGKLVLWNDTDDVLLEDQDGNNYTYDLNYETANDPKSKSWVIPPNEFITLGRKISIRLTKTAGGNITILAGARLDLIRVAGSGGVPSVSSSQIEDDSDTLETEGINTKLFSLTQYLGSYTSSNANRNFTLKNVGITNGNKLLITDRDASTYTETWGAKLTRATGFYTQLQIGHVSTNSAFGPLILYGSNDVEENYILNLGTTKMTSNRVATNVEYVDNNGIPFAEKLIEILETKGINFTEQEKIDLVNETKINGLVKSGKIKKEEGRNNEIPKKKSNV